MRKLFFAVILILFVSIISCSTTNNLHRCVRSFDGRGQISLSYEESQYGLNLTLETADPVALRTLLMQGFRLFLPNGENDTLIIVFPSAKSVSNDIEHHPGEVKATLDRDSNTEKRPDLRPLVAALNKAEILLKSSDSITSVPFHQIDINSSTGVLSYKFVIPSEQLSRDYSSTIILVSQPDSAMIQQDEFGSRNFKGRSSENRPQPFGVGQQQRNESHKKSIIIEFDTCPTD